jgi:hypothetical protein
LGDSLAGLCGAARRSRVALSVAMRRDIEALSSHCEREAKLGLRLT